METVETLLILAIGSFLSLLAVFCITAAIVGFAV
jgi:hypothetical protein